MKLKAVLAMILGAVILLPNAQAAGKGVSSAARDSVLNAIVQKQQVIYNGFNKMNSDYQKMTKDPWCSNLERDITVYNRLTSGEYFKD